MGEPSIFRWESIQVIGADTLPFTQPVSGFELEIELTGGSRIKVFRATDGEFYFCHGMTFGGTDAPGGAISPYGKDVAVIVAEFYSRVQPEGNAVAGDVVIWYDLDGVATHSAILTGPISGERMRLDYASTLRSKNGRQPEAILTLGKLVEDSEGYGESYAVFRRQ